MSVTFTTSVAGTAAQTTQAFPAGQPLGGQDKTAAGKELPDTSKGIDDKARALLDKAINELRSNLQSVHRNLEFSLDEGSGLTVVKVVDSSSGEVIRQIPSEVVVKLAENFKESSNLLLQEKA